MPTKQREKRGVNAVTEASKPVQQEVSPSMPIIAKSVTRPPGHCCMVEADNGMRPIEHTIICNGQSIEAVVDSGATVPVISHELVKKYKWNLKEINTALKGANNNLLGCPGILRANLTVCIGRTTKSTTHDLLVVE